MNYQSIYNNLIEKCKTEQRMKNMGIYYELHHILPNSWGGTDEAFNMVLLTAREHWIAHLLLSKIATGNNKYKAAQAVVNMGRVITSEKRKNSKLYESARKCIADEVSKKHKNTLIVKDAITDIRIGRVSKQHPKVLSGEWVFFHKGMKRSDEYKKKISKSICGEKNGTFTGMTNETILKRCVEVFNKYGVWTYTITTLYCKLKYNEKIPKTMGGNFREPVNSHNIKKYLIENYNATNLCFDTFAKHHTKRILKEIENEFNN